MTSMATLSSISRLHAVCENELFTFNSTLSYERTLEAITALCNAASDYTGDNADLWAIGEWGNASLDSMIVGAYWFGVHYGSMMHSTPDRELTLQSAASAIFAPGCSDGPEPESSESIVYDMLELRYNESLVA